MILEKFSPGTRDTWFWHRAGIFDVSDIVLLAQRQFQREIESVFTPDPEFYAHNVTLACVNQNFDASKCQLIIARDITTKKLLAYAWLARGIYMPYARDECAEAAFLHMDLNLPLRQRITLMAQILQQWQLWCQVNSIPVLVSSSIREDQTGFMNLHKDAGFDIRGSIAYKKIL